MSLKRWSIQLAFVVFGFASIVWGWFDSMRWETSFNASPHIGKSATIINYGSAIAFGYDPNIGWDLVFGRERVTGNDLVDPSRNRVWFRSLESRFENGAFEIVLPYWVILLGYSGALLALRVRLHVRHQRISALLPSIQKT